MLQTDKESNSKYGSPSEGVHWSVDFVQHLRTVHFALMALAMGLLLIATSTRERDSEIAVSQISEIVSFCDAWRPGWPGWLQASPNSEDLRMLGPTELVLPVSGTEPGLSIRNKDELFVTVSARGSASLKIPLLLRLRLPKPNLAFFDKPTVAYLGNENRLIPTSNLVPEHAPEKLGEFRDWWDEINASTALVPTHIEAKIRVMPYGYAGDGGQLIEELSAWKGIVITSLAPDSVPPTRAPDIEADLKFSNRMYLPSSEYAAPDDLDWLVGKYFYYALIQQPGLDHNIAVVLPITTSVTPSRFLLSWPHRLGHGWSATPSGTFEEAFGELSVATRALAAVDLKTIQDHLLQSEGHQSDSFEAFGVKFPAEQVTQWGAMLLLCVQVYFWLHIHEVKGKLRPLDPGWDVAWIGVYRTPLSQWAFAFSLLLPPVTMAVLYYASLSRILSQQSRWWESLMQAVGPLAIFVSASVSYRTLMSIPKARRSDINRYLLRLRARMRRGQRRTRRWLWG